MLARVKKGPTKPDAPLPHNIEAEQALIGAIMVNNTAFARVAAMLTSGDFYEEIHREIYEVMAHLIETGRVANPVTMKGFLADVDLSALGMTIGQYLARLTAEATTVINAIDYAGEIKDTSLRRQLFIECEQMQARILANDPGDGAVPLLDNMEGALAAIRPTRQSTSGYVAFDKAAQRAVDNAAKAYERGEVLAGLSTGIKKLDDALGGLQQTDLVIVGGRPAMGKSALATNVAYAVARSLRERIAAGERPQDVGVVGVVSLEMSDDQVASRILAERSRISGWRLRKGQVSEEEFEAFAAAARDLENLPIHTDATPDQTIAHIAMRARQVAKRSGLALLVVDYLQLIKGGSRSRENRTQELAEITAGLKNLAKELNIPIIALAQVSRDVEKRDDKRPKMSDLRESGSIEQDADIVLLLYRDEYYLKQAEPKKDSPPHADWKDAVERAHGRAEIIVGKNRHGPTDTIHVGYDGTLTQFKDELPEQVAAAPRERATKQAKLQLIREATTAFGYLKSLTISHSIANEGHVDRAPRGTKLVSYMDWKTRCCEQLLDPEAADAAKVTLMKKICADLAAPKSGHEALIGRGGSTEHPYVWLTPEASK